MNLAEPIKQIFLTSRSGKRIAKMYRHYRNDCYVISFPKCGRTWLRVMIAKALALHYQIPSDTVFDASDVIKAGYRKALRIGFRHDGADVIPDSTKESFKRRYHKYRKKRVILLVRDPRDVVVSYYFHRTRRMMEQHDLSDFIRNTYFGIGRIIAFMNEWYDHRDVPKGFLLVRYEDLHRDPGKEIHRVFSFVGVNDISNENISKAVEYGSFDNLRELLSSRELEKSKFAYRLVPADFEDPESHKLRRGEIGGYVEYLQTADIDYLNGKIESTLLPIYGY